jgi:holo-[acyl-carrier protein] synthase
VHGVWEDNPVDLRVGLDLVSIADVRRSLADHGDHYLKRVFTAREVADCGGAERPSAERLAARYAAKEAAIKVLRPVDEPTPWAAIEVLRDEHGATSLRLSGACAALAEQAGLTGFAVSLTHEGDYAAAAVIAYQTGTCVSKLEPRAQEADD